jgi:hypothetical protein
VTLQPIIKDIFSQSYSKAICTKDQNLRIGTGAASILGVL